MPIWSAEIKELEKLYESLKGQYPELEKELEQLIQTIDANVIMLYSRRCLEVIITDLCECELKRPRKTEPLKGIIDKLHKEDKVPSHIISSMHGLNELSTYGAHPKDFDPEQVKPVLVNLDIIIKWYLKYKETGADIKTKPVEEIRREIKGTEEENKSFRISKLKLISLVYRLILLIVIVVAVLFLTKIIGDGKKLKELEKSIAVLPFINESPVDSNKHFINGIMEEILNNLQTIKEFRILSRTSTDQYKGPDRPTMPEIARKLNVNYIVEGSGQKYGNTFTLRVQLIRAKGKETHLWGKTYNEEIRGVRDYIRIQSEVAQAIAAELKVAITPEEIHLIDKLPTTSLTAYDFYQRGRDEHTILLFSNVEKLDVLPKVEKFYKKALEYDRDFAKAYTGLAQVYWDKHVNDQNYSENFMDSVLLLCDIALRNDKQLSEAYIIRGNYFARRKENTKASEEYEKALKFNPNSWEVYYRKGIISRDYIDKIENYNKAASLNHGAELPHLLRRIGNEFLNVGFPEKARFHFDEAFKLDGDTIFYLFNLGTIEVDTGNYAKALEYAQKEVTAGSRNIWTLNRVGDGYLRLNKYDDALKYFKMWIDGIEALGEYDYLLRYMPVIGYLYLKNGNKKEADYYFDKMIDSYNKDIESGYTKGIYDAFNLACVQAIRGENEKAYKNLKIKFQSDIVNLMEVNDLKLHPIFNSIRNETEFQQIVKEVESKYQAEHERVRKWLAEKGML